MNKRELLKALEGFADDTPVEFWHMVWNNDEKFCAIERVELQDEADSRSKGYPAVILVSSEVT